MGTRHKPQALNPTILHDPVPLTQRAIDRSCYPEIVRGRLQLQGSNGGVRRPSPARMMLKNISRFDGQA
jgi:hypothetical protein